MSMSFGYRGAPEDFARPELAAARERVFRACRSAGIAFLEGVTRDTVEAKIAEGVRVFNAADEATAMRGRAIARQGDATA